MLTRYDKAFTAGLAPALGTILFAILAKYNFELTPELQAAVITILTAFLVYLVPNKQ